MSRLDRLGLTLLAERAVWQETTRTLWIADLHLGKAASFRALGQPAPAGTTQENLRRLSELIDVHAARRLVVLGDFLHARAGRTPALFSQLAEWRAAQGGVEIVVVRGNHDARAGDAPDDCGFMAVDEPFTLAGVEGWHEAPPRPDTADGPVFLSGHLHPVAWLSGPGRDRLRLPCFCLRARGIVLPAFGEFTGCHPVDPQEWEELVATSATRLFPLPRRVLRCSAETPKQRA
jgi:uncharacterized protein